MRKVSNGANGLVEQIQGQANSLAQSALRSAEIVSVATLLLLLLVLLITTFVARSMIRPLRKLRADALEVAGSKLPDMVRRLSQSEGGDASAEIEPIGVNSTDEIGEVARAFDQVHREAVRLAADEAMLRGNLNAMFVNLSRRSQSLIERQLSLIDNLEQTEQDADRLSSLFRLDHLATRMRRNSENLLVLAGHEAQSRRWSQPVPAWSTCSAPRSPRSSSTSGSCSTSSPASRSSARPSTTWSTWWPRSWRTRPPSRPKTPRCT